MGFFRILNGGFAFQRLAKSLKCILDNVHLYHSYHNIDYLYKAAWIYKFGVIDSLEKWNWSVFAKISIPDYQRLGRITLNEAIIIAASQIGASISELTEEEREYVNDIMAGEQAYHDVCHLLSLDDKDKLRP